jgi:hypothetical protein
MLLFTLLRTYGAVLAAAATCLAGPVAVNNIDPNAGTGTINALLARRDYHPIGDAYIDPLTLTKCADPSSTTAAQQPKYDAAKESSGKDGVGCSLRQQSQTRGRHERHGKKNGHRRRPSNGRRPATSSDCDETTLMEKTAKARSTSTAYVTVTGDESVYGEGFPTESTSMEYATETSTSSKRQKQRPTSTRDSTASERTTADYATATGTTRSKPQKQKSTSIEDSTPKEPTTTDYATSTGTWSKTPGRKSTSTKITSSYGEETSSSDADHGYGTETSTRTKHKPASKPTSYPTVPASAWTVTYSTSVVTPQPKPPVPNMPNVDVSVWMQTATMANTMVLGSLGGGAAPAPVPAPAPAPAPVVPAEAVTPGKPGTSAGALISSKPVATSGGSRLGGSAVAAVAVAMSALMLW